MTGPVCAFTASIWRTRSSSFGGVVMLVLADAVLGVGGKRSDRRQAGLDLLPWCRQVSR